MSILKYRVVPLCARLLDFAVLVRESMDVVRKGESCGTVGDVLPGSLLGPILGLAFSTDGGLLFAGCGSSISTYDVRSGAILSTARVFTPGVAVCGIDVGRESCEFRSSSWGGEDNNNNRC